MIDPTRAWQPIVPVWGVVADVSWTTRPATCSSRPAWRTCRGRRDGRRAGALFSLVAADGQVSLGSTFLPEQPDPAALGGRLRRAGERFVPGLRRAEVVGARACARPQSLDGRPLVGRLPGQEGLWVAAGHGPWGISTGPATRPHGRGRAAGAGRGARAAVGGALLGASRPRPGRAG